MSEADRPDALLDTQGQLRAEIARLQRELAEIRRERNRVGGAWYEHQRAEAAEKQRDACFEELQSALQNLNESCLETEAAEKRAAANQRAADALRLIEQHCLEVKQHSRGGWSIRGDGHTRAKSLIEGIELHCCDKSKAKTIALAPPAPAETSEGKETEWDKQ